ncbi:protein FAM220A isoform X1 [Sarcophilus harrisii]|nr:protein FAM220A isoform X1 [Sarcophilus harrisii]XP_031797710.1 protein FAM220A isoform X1 [Sarcophilus harrisii]XP_031797717.1 protein FAM220A isoform X1 [Sarcophilus harrisii]
METLRDRRTTLASCLINMKGEEDIGSNKLFCKVNLRQQKEIPHLSDTCAWSNKPGVDFNRSLHKELFSSEMKNYLGKTDPLPHIGNKMPPYLRKSTRRNSTKAAAQKESVNVVFPAKEHHFAKIFCGINEAILSDWLERAICFINDLREWCHVGDNFVRFANFWLSELPYKQKINLLKLEMGIFEDELQSAFFEEVGAELEVSHLHSVLSATLCEYPEVLLNDETKYVFLDYLNLMSSEQTIEYKKMLSSLKCTTNNLQIALWLLALRAFALANLWHAVVKFYKAVVRSQPPPGLPSKSSVSATRKQKSDLFKERAFQCIQLGYIDVLHYLIKSQQTDLYVVDENNRNMIFLSVIYNQPKILEYFLDMESPIPNVNQAAENGNTPLHAAVNTRKTDIMSLLLRFAEIDVNAPNHQCNGATALHLAIIYGHLDICYLLLKAAADPEIPMGELTPLQLAQQMGNTAIESLIRFHVNKLKKGK